MPFMQVAKSIKLVMGLRSASIIISLDTETIGALHLPCINAKTVKESILKTPRIKLKDKVRIANLLFFF